MKTIATLEGVEFLKQLNRIRKMVAGPLAKLEIVKTLQVPPVLTGEETEAERMEKAKAQTAINMDILLDRILEEHPDETLKLLKEFVIVEENEEPKGIDYMASALELITDKRVIDFLSSLMKSGLLSMGR